MYMLHAIFTSHYDDCTSIVLCHLAESPAMVNHYSCPNKKILEIEEKKMKVNYHTTLAGILYM